MHPSCCIDVIMGVVTSQITSLTIVHSTVYSDADQRKHRSSASLAFVWGIHRGPCNAERVSIWWHHHGTVIWDALTIMWHHCYKNINPGQNGWSFANAISKCNVFFFKFQWFFFLGEPICNKPALARVIISCVDATFYWSLICYIKHGMILDHLIS